MQGMGHEAIGVELTQFVNDLRTITAEVRDPRASLVRVPSFCRAHGSFQPDWVQSVADESAPREGLAITRRARGTDTRRSRS
jgi:hypothetical protein